MNDRLQQFLDLSAEITCFTRFELQGTGQLQPYFDTTRKAAGPVLDDLLDAYADLQPDAGQSAAERNAALRKRIFGDEKLGPVARAIIKLWYVGIWYELPRAWTEAYGARRDNTSFMVSPASYAEGLLWVAIGAHPPGAKAPGYGSWAGEPVIPEFGGAGPSEAGPIVTQTEPGHVSPHTAPKPQHPPPPAQGPS
jgi:hypothetical protein